jgi:hypothetical protein
MTEHDNEPWDGAYVHNFLKFFAVILEENETDYLISVSAFRRWLLWTIKLRHTVPQPS